ncbi:MAG: hypothetical protein H8D74_00545 [Chloroflexi bacterium]|nr:hypothetical protein [Chloroflexota bacterium]
MKVVPNAYADGIEDFVVNYHFARRLAVSMISIRLRLLNPAPASPTQPKSLGLRRPLGFPAHKWGWSSRSETIGERRGEDYARCWRIGRGGKG